MIVAFVIKQSALAKVYSLNTSTDIWKWFSKQSVVTFFNLLIFLFLEGVPSHDGCGSQNEKELSVTKWHLIEKLVFSLNGVYMCVLNEWDLYKCTRNNKKCRYATVHKFKRPFLWHFWEHLGFWTINVTKWLVTMLFLHFPKF